MMKIVRIICLSATAYIYISRHMFPNIWEFEASIQLACWALSMFQKQERRTAGRRSYDVTWVQPKSMWTFTQCGLKCLLVNSNNLKSSFVFYSLFLRESWCRSNKQTVYTQGVLWSSENLPKEMGCAVSHLIVPRYLSRNYTFYLSVSLGMIVYGMDLTGIKMYFILIFLSIVLPPRPIQFVCLPLTFTTLGRSYCWTIKKKLREVCLMKWKGFQHELSHFQFQHELSGISGLSEQERNWRMWRFKGPYSKRIQFKTRWNVSLRPSDI